ncbi:HalOD1 output domain-containing protein [Halovivax sp.]|uniref:HalOD1 output domain-containing protein n=1 Tax=Halovivax sp. TaxID=1935978 RepID=UPI0025C394B7|nr:HalOD1 output domain-containing protein [Halovivax sp.]
MIETRSSAVDGETVYEAVVRALSIATNADPAQQRPLYAAVDPEALDALFDGRAGGRIVFEHMDHRIVVDSADETRVLVEARGKESGATEPE